MKGRKRFNSPRLRRRFGWGRKKKKHVKTKEKIDPPPVVEQIKESEAVLKPSEPIKEPKPCPNPNADQYVYNANDTTLYDCIVKAKELDLDMTEINSKLGSVPPAEFIEWFKRNYWQ